MCQKGCTGALQPQRCRTYCRTLHRRIHFRVGKLPTLLSFWGWVFFFFFVMFFDSAAESETDPPPAALGCNSATGNNGHVLARSWRFGVHLDRNARSLGRSVGRYLLLPGGFYGAEEDDRYFIKRIISTSRLQHAALVHCVLH